MLNEGYIEKVYYRFWQADNNLSPLANVFAIHGLGGHCIWFDNAGKLLNKNNINLFSFDLPGFGQSKYTKGHISSYKEWVDTTRVILENFLHNFHIKTPVFILGHSMGALISIMLASKVKPHGWIISVPAFDGHPKTWNPLNFIFPVLFKAIVKPKATILLPFGPELLTKNKETQLNLKKDPLRITNPSARLFYEVYMLTLRAKLSCRFIKDPILMLQAGKDLVCSNTAMDKCFLEVTSQDKYKKVYTNSFHDLFVEDELEEIVLDISEWIKKRL